MTDKDNPSGGAIKSGPYLDGGAIKSGPYLVGKDGPELFVGLDLSSGPDRTALFVGSATEFPPPHPLVALSGDQITQAFGLPKSVLLGRSRVLDFSDSIFEMGTASRITAEAFERMRASLPPTRLRDRLAWMLDDVVDAIRAGISKAIDWHTIEVPETRWTWPVNLSLKLKHGTLCWQVFETGSDHRTRAVVGVVSFTSGCWIYDHREFSE